MEYKVILGGGGEGIELESKTSEASGEDRKKEIREIIRVSVRNLYKRDRVNKVRL